jgi:hypothetical protein
MKHFMKPTLFVLITLLGTSLAILPAHAQSFSRVRVNVPFDFSVGNTPLKAGNYTVSQLEPGIIVFSGNDGQQSQIAATVVLDSVNHNQKPQLVFTRYGSEVFLNRIFLAGYEDGHELRRSEREKQLIQQRMYREELSLLVEPTS